jgi:hypothetical protein
MRHNWHMRSGIKSSVETFHTDVPSALEASASGGIYTQVRISDEQPCANSSGLCRTIFGYRCRQTVDPDSDSE